MRNMPLPEQFAVEFRLIIQIMQFSQEESLHGWHLQVGVHLLGAQPILLWQMRQYQFRKL